MLMKGHKWRDHAHKMTYPAWCEIKYDEVRVRVVVHNPGTEFCRVEFLSFAGKPLFNLEQFEDGFVHLASDTGHRTFDLGFEANGNFADTLRWVRSSKKGIPPEIKDAPVRWILFDVPECAGMEFERRVCIRKNIAACGVAVGLPMQEPDGFWVHSPEDVDAMFIKARERGLEGLMVKSLQHKYEPGKRSYGWLKVKPEDDADGVIIALEEAIAGKDQPELGISKGDRLGRVGSVTVRIPSEETGGVGELAGNVAADAQPEAEPAYSIATPHGIPHELGRDMLLHPDKYLGQWVEFKYMERDRQGGYRHPTFHRLREEKM